MIRKLITPAFAALALAIVGCSHSSAIRAQAPGSGHPMAGKVKSSGEYALYHVTKFNSVGQPMNAEKIVTYDLEAGDRLGFEWETPQASLNSPTAAVELEAFAGSHERNLGPITLQSEKYFWASPSGWNNYWKHVPRDGFFRRVTMQ